MDNFQDLLIIKFNLIPVLLLLSSTGPMDKASDYGSEDYGFKSHVGYIYIFFLFIYLSNPFM